MSIESQEYVVQSAPINNNDMRMTTYIVLKFIVNRFHIMLLSSHYAFWTGKPQIGLNVKKKLFSKFLVKISSMNLFKINRDRRCVHS